MRRTLLVLVLGLAVVAFVAAGCGGDDEEGAGTTETTETTTDTGSGSETEENELYASVGPGFEISLTTEDGEDVTSIPAGEYRIEVNDQSDIHNFHLTGPGVDTSTTVEELTETAWDLDLEAGEFTFVCDPHASSMNGSFTVS